MIVRRLTQLYLVCLAFSLTLFAQNQGTSFLLQLPGADSGNGRLLGYLANTNDLAPDLDTTGPTNAFRVVATPTGSKFYIISDGPVQTLDATLQTFSVLNGVTGPFTTAKVTPNGKYLLLGGANFYIVDTQTNTVVASNLGFSGAFNDMVISNDSKTAWILQNFGAVSSVTPINLSNLTAGTRTDLPYSGAVISLSPLGVLYVSSSGRIAEYKSSDLSLVSTITVVGTPGPIKFSPDGSRAFFVNTTPQNVGRSIQTFRTVQRDVTEWPPFSFVSSAPVVSDLFVVSNDRLLAFDRSARTLYDVAASPLSGQVATLNGNVVGNDIYGVTVSNEFPSARYLYVITSGSSQPSLRRINLADNSMSINANATSTNGILQFLAIPPQSGAANIYKYNDSQLLPGGGPAKRLILRITDSLGRPVFNQPVSISSSSGSGVTIGTPDQVTSSEGFAESDVAVPNTPGTYTFDVIAGGATTSFTVTVPGSSTGGGGGTNSLITIIRGNGQVIKEFTPINDGVPLTARIKDAAGNPLGGVPVTFTTVSGSGVPLPYSDTTDEDGTISSGFFAQLVSNGQNFEANVVRAESPYGTVDFYVTVVSVDPRNQSGAPQTLIQTPNTSTVTVGRGDVVKDLFVVETKATRFPQIGEPIPHVGLRIGGDPNPLDDGPGACVNDTLSDNLGISRCDFKTSCTIGNQQSIYLVIGEFRLSPLILNVVPGNASAVTVLSGNAQTGNVGQALPNLLAARVTDNCGTPIVGKSVVWTVVQGAATLSQVSSVSASDGRVTARVTLGGTPGTITIRVAIEGATPATFTLTSQAVVSSISLVSGGSQTAVVGTQFASPVVFQIRDNNNLAVGAGLTVNFSISGAGTLLTGTTTTDASGRAQVGVTAAGTPGAITVTATVLGFSASANLTAVPAGLNLTSAMFTNAASGAVGLVPCGLVTLTAPGVAATVNGVLLPTGFGRWPNSLGPIDSLTINGSAAPLQAVSNVNGKQQVNFQVPCEVNAGSANVVVTVNGQANSVSGVPVFASQPGIFTTTSNGKNYGVVIRSDGNVVSTDTPARTNEKLWLVVTGLGQTNPPLTTNNLNLNNSSQVAIVPTIIGVNNAGVAAQPGKPYPGYVGVYYVEFTIPLGAALGNDQPLVAATVNGSTYTFSNSVYLQRVVAGQ